jgi:hypothetical protein
MEITVKAIILAASALFLFRCADHIDVNAGSSVSGNAKVAGLLYDENGNPAKNAQVAILPVDFNPRSDSALPPSFSAVTDTSGAYSFDIADSGTYNIFAIGSDQKNILIQSVHFVGKPIDVPSDTLRSYGAIKMPLPDSIDPALGYVYIPGTPLVSDASSAQNGFVFVNKVPPVTIPNITFSASGSSAERVIARDVVVTPGDTTTIINPSLRYRTRLILNTTASGADVHDAVYNFPVYVMLTQWNFDFTQAMAGGEDIRFTKPDGTKLAYEIEKWDPGNGIAELWVKVDTVLGDNNAQNIIMYWGATAMDSTPSSRSTTSLSNGAAVFDTANGFQGVWHLAESDSDTAYDATVNHYNGIPCFSQRESSSLGNMGGFWRFFNGSGCILMPQTQASKLDIPQNGIYTISAWISAAMPDTTSKVKVIIGGNGQYSLIMRSEEWVSRWEMVLASKSLRDINPVYFGAWYYVVGVSSSAGQFFYINGALVQSPDSAFQHPVSIPRTTGGNFAIGGLYCSQDSLQGCGYFNGFIGEVRFSNVIRSADWIKLCYANQQPMNRLVLFESSLQPPIQPYNAGKYF